MPPMECEVCGGTDFYKETGHFYCSECQTQSQQVREHVFDQETVHRQSTKKIQVSGQDLSSRNLKWPWVGAEPQQNQAWWTTDQLGVLQLHPQRSHKRAAGFGGQTRAESGGAVFVDEVLAQMWSVPVAQQYFA